MQDFKEIEQREGARIERERILKIIEQEMSWLIKIFRMAGANESAQERIMGTLISIKLEIEND